MKIYSFYINLRGYDSISDALKARMDIYNVSIVGDGEMGTDEWGSIDFLTAYGLSRYQKCVGYCIYLIKMDYDIEKLGGTPDRAVYEYIHSLVVRHLRSNKLEKLLD